MIVSNLHITFTVYFVMLIKDVYENKFMRCVRPKYGKQENDPMTADEQYLSLYKRKVIYNSAPTAELFR